MTQGAALPANIGEALYPSEISVLLVHDFRRTAVRRLERAGVARSVVMKLVGHKTEAIYGRYAIVSESTCARRRGSSRPSSADGRSCGPAETIRLRLSSADGPILRGTPSPRPSLPYNPAHLTTRLSRPAPACWPVGNPQRHRRGRHGARSIGRATRGSIALWRSRFSPRPVPDLKARFECEAEGLRAL